VSDDVEPSPTLEARAYRCVCQLEAQPAARYGWDVQGAGFLQGESGPPVSVVLGIRTPGGIATGELQVPRERWDMAAFVAHLEAQGVQE
jgi:hypothetical protein